MAGCQIIRHLPFGIRCVIRCKWYITSGSWWAANAAEWETKCDMVSWCRVGNETRHCYVSSVDRMVWTQWGVRSRSSCLLHWVTTVIITSACAGVQCDVSRVGRNTLEAHRWYAVSTTAQRPDHAEPRTTVVGRMASEPIYRTQQPEPVYWSTSAYTTAMIC